LVGEKEKEYLKTCASATFSTTLSWLVPGSNPGRSGEKPIINRLSYVTAEVNSLYETQEFRGVLPFV
jgi:hypothetical protein